jgi:PAS domain S-box-containing protein
MTAQDEMMRRQRVLADFGDFVLDHEDLEAILMEGCRLVAEALGADLAKVIEIEREARTGLVRAGVGWRPGVVGRQRLSLDERSSEAYAIERAEPIITNDVAEETRFAFPAFLREHGVVALVNVPILLPGRRPWGVLQVDAREARAFDQADTEFLKTYAMILGPVIDRFLEATERREAEAALRETEELRRIALEGGGMGAWRWDTRERSVRSDPAFQALWGVAFGDRWHPVSAYTDRMDSAGAARLEAVMGASIAPGEDFEDQVQIIAGSTAGRWVQWRGRAEQDRPWLVNGVSFDITNQVRADQKLRESEARLATAFESVPAGVAVVDATGVAQVANAEFYRFLPGGKMPWCDPELEGRWKIWDANGEPLDREDYPGARALRGEHVVPGQEVLYTDDDGRDIWVSVAAAPIPDETGAISGLVTVITDVDAPKRLAERQKLLLAELQHRVRNILAMVRSIVRRTVETGETVDQVGDHLDGRLASLARTQIMLTRATGVGVGLEALIREELLAQNADSAAVTLEGPEIQLAPKAAELLTLAVHELATNATKYGALAKPGASLDVRWSVEPRSDAASWLHLVWCEHGVSMVAGQPRRSGFGTELIRRRVPYELKGFGEITFRPGGVRAEVSFPLVPGSSLLATDLPPGFFSA